MQVARELPKLCVEFHEDVQRLSADFLSQQRRHYYVTSTSYLELLTSYKKLLAKKQDEVCLWHWATSCACARCRIVPAAKPQGRHAHGCFRVPRTADWHSQEALRDRPGQAGNVRDECGWDAGAWTVHTGASAWAACTGWGALEGTHTPTCHSTRCW